MKQLIILGSGVRNIQQLTLEAFDHIKTSDIVVVWGGAEGAEAFLDIHAKKWVSANDLYQDGGIDCENYSRIENAIVDKFNAHDKVAVMVHGHPRVGVTFVQSLGKTVAGKDIKIIVLPGVSSFDTMLNDVELDPLEEGSCVVDANRLVLYNYEMDSRLNYFIYHVSSIGNKFTDYTAPTLRNKSAFLQEKLLEHYSPSQKVILVKSAITQVSQSRLIEGTVGALGDLLNQVDFSSSLFIPATLPTAECVNQQFLDLLVGGE